MAGRDCDPAHAPCAPPYFYGKSRVRLIYTGSLADTENPGAGNGPNWRKIINNMTMSFPNYGTTGEGNEAGFDDRLRAYEKFVGSNDIERSPSYVNIMQITASLNLKGIIAPDPNQVGGNRWVISPYMETPVLDFSESQTPERGYGRGMWSGYGEIPKNNKGIYFGIERAPNEFLNRQDVEDMTQWFTNTGRSRRESQIVGSTNLETANNESLRRQVGQIAEKKTISEAIVAIPYVEKRISASSGNAKTIHRKILNKNFFTLSGLSLNESKNMFTNPPNNSISIPRLKEMMGKYILPPQLDFNKYSDIEPFVMYFMEFEHELSQDELKDIWQGVMPDIAMVPELDQVALYHQMNEDEFFGGRPLPDYDGIRWMVFKVKRRAAANYYAVTKDSYDAPTNRDPAFQTLFTNPVGLEYSYNWPYDYFSLVELAQIDVENNFVTDVTERLRDIAAQEGQRQVQGQRASVIVSVNTGRFDSEGNPDSNGAYDSSGNLISDV